MKDDPSSGHLVCKLPTLMMVVSRETERKEASIFIFLMTSKHLGACHCCWQASICLPSFLISRCKSMSLCCPYKNHDTGFAGKHLSSWNSDGNGVIWRLLLKGIHHFSNIQQTRGDAQKVEMSADGTSVRCEIYGIFKINFSLYGNSPKLSQFCHRSTKKLNFLYAMKSFFEWQKLLSLKDRIMHTGGFLLFNFCCSPCLCKNTFRKKVQLFSPLKKTHQILTSVDTWSAVHFCKEKS